MTQAEREILEGRSKCAFEVIKQLQKRCFLLRGEVKRLRDEEMSLISEVKRLRAENAELCKQLELEHDQGEAFIVQIKELIKDRDRLPINIIFDAPPSHDSGRFVEVETDDGKSIRVGEWIEKDGYWALRITELPKAIDTEMDSEWEIEFIRFFPLLEKRLADIFSIWRDTEMEAEK